MSFHGFQRKVFPTEKFAANRPNIILINLDDADREMFDPAVIERFFPSINSIARRGITFTNFHVTTPLCGPSRACLLRGQYAHSIDHRTNDAKGANTRGFRGDFKSFMEKGYFDDDIGMWMKQAGYHTSFVGKYINFVDSEKRIPAGWDDFYRSHGSRYYATSRFTNRKKINGSSDKIPDGIYRTDAEAKDVVDLIERHAHKTKPMFVYFAPFGPHSQGKAPGGMIDTKDAGEWLGIKQKKLSDFDEGDMSDKPHVYQMLPKLSDHLLKKLENDYRQRMLAVRSIDRAIDRIIKVLESKDALENTYIFITSDNGYSLGQHRMSGKGNSMSRSSHVPLIVAGPSITKARTANHLLAHIDLAPTFMSLAGVAPKACIDGKSFAPLLGNYQRNDPKRWRDAILIENWQTRRFTRFTFNTTFCQLRTYDSIYTEWADGSREFYDLSEDPLELANKYRYLNETQQSLLSEQLKDLRNPQTTPIVTIENSEADPYLINGVAEDSSGIDSVEILIRSEANGLYWSGNEWQPRPVVLNAVLKNPGGIQTEWTYHIQSVQKKVTKPVVIPQAIARNGNRSTEVHRQNNLKDTRSPVTRIHNIRFPNGKKARITGRAFDNEMVAKVQLHLQNLDNGLYFNGTDWVAECECIFCQTNGDDRWEIVTPKLTIGNYVVRARSFDRVGNREEKEQQRRFQIK